MSEVFPLSNPVLLESLRDNVLNGSYLMGGLDDPTVVTIPAFAGTVYIQYASNSIPGTQVVKVWQKQDNGATLNWIPLNGIFLQQAGVPVSSNPFSTLNFLNGTIITDAGNGVADIQLTGGGGGGGPTYFYHTVTGPEVAAKKFAMPAAPAIPSQVTADVIGGTPQQYNVSYVVAAGFFDWTGLALDGYIGAGDVIRLGITP